MSEFEIINHPDRGDGVDEITLHVPCTEIPSGGEWPDYLVTDINNARIRLENRGHIGVGFCLRIPCHLYKLFKQLKIKGVPAQDWLKDNLLIEKINPASVNEDSVSLMTHRVYCDGLSGLDIIARALKITGVSISQSLQGASES